MSTRPALRLIGLLLLAAPLLAGCDLIIDLSGDGDGGNGGGGDPAVVSVYADSLAAPVGIEVDRLGQLWVTETGAGRISVVTSDGERHSLVTGLPVEVHDEEVVGAWRTVLTPSGELLIVQGEGADSLSRTLLSADVLNFLPGNDTPLDFSDLDVVAEIGPFALEEQGFAESNPYAVLLGPDGNHYVVDAAANAIFRRDAATGDLSVFATFDDIPNPTPVGPPAVNAVPTDIVYADGQFYVSSLTGFPFASGAARIYEVDMDGNVSVYQDGLTAVTDLAVEPGTGDLLALQFAEFDPASGFLPNTGRVVRVTDDGIESIVEGLNLTAGLHANAPGDLFVSSLGDGQVLRVTYTP